MIKILSYKDIKKLKDLKVNEEIQNLIKEKFQSIYKEVTNDDTLKNIDKFKLNKIGGMIIIENSKDIEKIKTILGEDITDTYPEYINEINLKKEKVYEILILCNNEYGLQIFIPCKLVNTDEKLKSYINDNI